MVLSLAEAAHPIRSDVPAPNERLQRTRYGKVPKLNRPRRALMRGVRWLACES